MLISGGTGSGKTTLLNALADYIPEHERIVVIEDTKELRIGKPNLLGSECQTESHAATVNFNDLLKAALRSARQRGFARVALQVSTGNAAAIVLYESEGFRRAARLAGFYSPQRFPDGGDAWRMVRRARL